MPKASPIISAFNQGEFSPLMAGRVDVKYYPNACKRIRNFIPMVQGPARRRPGTRFVAEVKDSSQYTWLVRFEFNVLQAYVLEFGHQYIRFFSQHGVVGAPFEVATPYTSADLVDSEGFFRLRFVQSNDVVYIVHPSYAPRKLTRTGAATFTIGTLDQTGGPFEDVDPDATTTVYASAATGAGITLTASSAIFQSGHVGSLFYMEQKNTDTIKQWESGKVVVLNDVRRSDGKNYHALNGATTGSVRPTHSRGSKYDGDAGVQWQFDDPGYGWAKITAIGGGGTTATATVLSRFPDMTVGVGNPTNRWAFGKWNDVNGYPSAVAFWRERLCFGRNLEIEMSVAGDYENFAGKDDGGVVVADQAISINITSDKSNGIEWMAASDSALLVGTSGDEFAVSEMTTTEPLGPGNVKARKQSAYGSRHVRVQQVGDGIVFVQKAGRKVRDMRYQPNTDKWDASDLTVLAEHVTKGGIIDMAYQQEPDSTVWAVRADGALLGLTLNREQDVKGWHPHRIGGYSDADLVNYAVVESVADIPSPDGDRNELWMIVQRYINGSVKRYVEWMEYHHEEGDNPEDAFYVDCGLTLDNVKNATLTPGAGATVKDTTGVVFTAGAAIFAAGDVGKYIHYDYTEISQSGSVTWEKGIAKITGYTNTTHVTCTIYRAFPSTSTIAANDWRMTVTTVTGLSHLEGQTVQVMADGASHPDCVVTGGSITLTTPASKVHVGLQAPAVLIPMPLEAGAADGTAQTKTNRTSRLGIRFHDTLGVRYGADEDGQLDQILSRGGGDEMDFRPPLFTGDKVVSFPDGYKSPGTLCVYQDTVFPATVVALVPHTMTQDAR